MMFLLWIVGAIEITASVVWVVVCAAAGLNLWMLLIGLLVFLGTVTGSLFGMSAALRRPNRKGFGHALAGLATSSVALLLFLVLTVGAAEYRQRARFNSTPAGQRETRRLARQQGRIEKRPTARRFVERDISDAESSGPAPAAKPSASVLPRPLAEETVSLRPQEDTGRLTVQWQKVDDAWLGAIRSGGSVGFGKTPVFSEDGQFAYIVISSGSSGALLKARLPEFTINRRLQVRNDTFGYASGGVGLCSEGLLMQLRNPSRLVLLDPETLSPKKCLLLELGSVESMASSPSTPLVVVGTNGRVDLVNVATGMLADTWPPPAPTRKHVPSLARRGGLAMSEDGKRVFAGHRSGMFCFNIEQEKLDVLKQFKHEPMASPRRVWLGPSNQLILANGNHDCLFDVGNLDSLPEKIERGELRMFDPKTGNRTTLSDAGLIVQRCEGRPLRTSLESTQYKHTPAFFAVHPDGNRFLAASRYQAHFIEFRKEDADSDDAGNSRTTPSVTVESVPIESQLETVNNESPPMKWYKHGEMYTGVFERSHYSLPSTAYSADGKHFYVTNCQSRQTTLEEISTSDFKITRRLTLPIRFRNMYRCDKGLLLHGDRGELVLVGLPSLEVEKAFKEDRLFDTNYGPFCLAGDVSRVFLRGTYESKELLRVLDIPSGKMSSHYNADIPCGRDGVWPDPSGYTHSVASPDGKHLFVISRGNREEVLHLTYGESGATTLRDPISAQGEYPLSIVVSDFGGLLGIVSKRNCHIFDVDDTRQPMLVVPFGKALTYDKTTETIFVENGQGIVQAFNRQGKRLYGIPRVPYHSRTISSIEASPAGGQLLSSGRNGPYCVILPGTEPPRSVLSRARLPNMFVTFHAKGFKIPKPESAENPVAKKLISSQEPTESQPGVKVYEVYEIDRKRSRFAWSLKGDYLFYQSADYAVHRLSVPDFREVDIVRLPVDKSERVSSHLHCVREGIVAAQHGSRSMALLDESSLQPKKFCCRSSYSLRVDPRGAPLLLAGDRSLTGIDPVSGLPVDDLPCDWGFAVAPGGGHVYIGGGMIQRYAVTPEGFQLEASSEMIPEWGGLLPVVSSDGTLLAAWEKQEDEKTRKKIDHLVLHDARTLTKLKTVMPLAYKREYQDIDARRRLIRLADKSSSKVCNVELYDFDGNLVYRHELDDKAEFCSPDPQGRGFAAVSSGKLIWFEMVDK